MNMKMKIAISMVAAVCAVSVQADPMIPGGSEIDLQGIATLNGSLGKATADKSNVDVYAVEPLTGPYSLVPNETFVPTFNAFKFTGASATPLWQFSVGSKTYSFDLTDDSLVYQSSAALVVAGTGTLNITGYAPTTGTWDFSIVDATAGKNTFAFSFTDSNASTAVPDGGLTVALLSGALTAMSLIRRKVVS
jgi:hypothetical protein